MSYLEWADVPKSKRLLKGVKHVFFTNHQYNEVIIPVLRGTNVMSLKDFEKKFAYGNGHVTSVLIRNCRDWNVPPEDVIGNSPYDGEQNVFYLHTHQGLTRMTALLRGGILFVNGDYFNRAYFLCPTIESYQTTMNWLAELGGLLRTDKIA